MNGPAAGFSVFRGARGGSISSAADENSIHSRYEIITKRRVRRMEFRKKLIKFIMAYLGCSFLSLFHDALSTV
jgi:hypothetical protein